MMQLAADPPHPGASWVTGALDYPALHAAVVAPLVLIGSAVYVVRRRRQAGHKTDGGYDRSGSGSGSPTDRQPRA